MGTVNEIGENVNVTTIEELKEYARGMKVELPPFVKGEGNRFVARLKRPSAATLLSGGVPNGLMHCALQLFSPEDFEDEKKKLDNELLEDIQDSHDVLCYVAEKALVEPTYKEITELGIELTDEQLTAIYTFVMTGVNDLKFFRTGQNKD